tara:strand:+ start:72 stop:458 length:387 start_codon:yes stop_codon:yes gene_type:complete
MKSLTFLTAAVMMAMSMPQVGIAADGQLATSQIRDAVLDGTGTLIARDGSVVTAYFGPTGELRGEYKEQKFIGHWSAADDQLCLDLPETVDDGCWVIVHRHDSHFQLFTLVGRPVSNLEIERGNPNNY